MDHKTTRSNVLPYDIAAWLIAAMALLATILLHLLPLLLAGLLAFELIHLLAPFVRFRGVSGYRAKIVIVAFLAATVVVVLSLLIFGTAGFFRGSGGKLPTLFQEMADIVEGSLKTLPPSIVEYLPSDAEALKSACVLWLRHHAIELQAVGKGAMRATAHILVGMVIGSLIALAEVNPSHEHRPFSLALLERISRFGMAFRRVVFAQVRISGINTIFTALYLAVGLPLCGIHLPFTKTLIIITFIAGLIPVAGNLVSNAIIVIVSFSQSLNVVLSSLLFLIVVHKFEYFLNARIVGSQIQAKAWEILLAMVVMEAAFGLPGVIAAPIFYAYLKDELMGRELI